MKFCEKCRKKVEIGIVEKNRSKNIKGEKFQYRVKEAYCKICDSEIYVAKLNDENLASLNNTYRNAKNLIKIDEIKKILKKYNIGKRPLSLLLGWGETTLTRYIDGDIPSKPYSDKLIQILENKDYYIEILNKNKNNITNNAYTKSLKACSNINSDNTKISKIESVAKYILKSTTEVTPLALQKLLYYIQGFNKVLNDKFLFQEDCEAWVHGPVYKTIYKSYKEFGYDPIKEESIYYGDIEITKKEKEIIDAVILYFGFYSGKILEKMTHCERPWQIARKGLSCRQKTNRIIEKNNIENYFYTIKADYRVENTKDIKKYSEHLSNKVKEGLFK